MFSFVNIIGFTFANMKSFLDSQASLRSSKLKGRQITYEAIRPFLTDFACTTIGNSVQGHPVSLITMGDGPTKVLLWSQMHGNESTSTKGLLDILYFLKLHPALIKGLTLHCIPMLNPDGAAAYTRKNANQVDLNRDALDQSQVEARLLMSTYASFQPDFCFNLHGQRTIFGVGDKPCMLSFLAPAADQEKSITSAREQAMGVIGFISKQLQRNIPGQIGRYDDSYNPNCMGDYFQGQGTPTLLFECGQVGEDYQRENTRKWFAVSLLKGLQCITEKQFLVDHYTQIPEVNKSFVDILVKNARVDGKTNDIALQFRESLTSKGVEFIPIVHSIGNLDSLQAHKTVDFSAHKELTKPAVLVGEVAEWAQF